MVRTIQRLSPGQRTGYVVMNETEAVRKEGMQHPLRIKVGVESVGVEVTECCCAEEMEAVRKQGMHQPLRIKVGVERCGEWGDFRWSMLCSQQSCAPCAACRLFGSQCKCRQQLW